MSVPMMHQNPMLVATLEPLGIVSNDPISMLTTLQTEHIVARTRSGACTSPPTVPIVRSTVASRNCRSTPNSPIRELSPLTLDPLIEGDNLTLLPESSVCPDAAPSLFTLPICSVQVNHLANTVPVDQ